MSLTNHFFLLISHISTKLILAICEKHNFPRVSCSSVVERPTGVQKVIGSTPVGITRIFFRVACVTDTHISYIFLDSWVQLYT